MARADRRAPAPTFRRVALHGAARLVALLALAWLLAVPAAPAGAAGDLPLPAPAPKPRVVAPVAAPAVADPAGPVRGTMIMVHSGGWAGHDAYARDLLVNRPGAMLRARGWRTVSLDYEEGTRGLQDVMSAVDAEVARRTGAGPVCLYGESAGGHLALVAASRLSSVDCVIALGAPTDLGLYVAEAVAGRDGRIDLVAFQMLRFFGRSAAEWAPWNPATLGASIGADVLLIHEDDDPVVSRLHNERFAAGSPTTQQVDLEAGSAAGERFVHGTVSEAGLARYASALGSFADRAVAARKAERAAARTGCSQVTRPSSRVGLSRLQTALSCLARKDVRAQRTSAGGWQQTSVTLRGEVNAARVWANLRATTSGKRALAAVGSAAPRSSSGPQECRA